MPVLGSAGHGGSLPQPCAAQGQRTVHLPSGLKLPTQGAGAAVEGFLSYFPMPEPYLLAVCIPEHCGCSVGCFLSDKSVCVVRVVYLERKGTGRSSSTRFEAFQGKPPHKEGPAVVAENSSGSTGEQEQSAPGTCCLSQMPFSFSSFPTSAWAPRCAPWPVPWNKAGTDSKQRSA